MNLKQKMQLYDRLYNHADKLIKKHNPCKIKNGKCICGKPCCKDCRHLTKKGCNVECLMCKLHLCWETRSNFYKLSRILMQMQIKAYRHGLLHFRNLREETIKELQETVDGSNSN
jgi:hypothetical protein